MVDIPSDQVRLDNSRPAPITTYRTALHLTIIPSTSSRKPDWKFEVLPALTTTRQKKRPLDDVEPHDIYVTQRGVVTQFDLFLDENGNYEFEDDPPMTLYRSVPAAYRTLYTNAVWISPFNMRFYAAYLSNKEQLSHKCTFWAKPRGARLSAKKQIPIDPDIKNPGDHGIVGPIIASGAKTAKRTAKKSKTKRPAPSTAKKTKAARAGKKAVKKAKPRPARRAAKAKRRGR